MPCAIHQAVDVRVVDDVPAALSATVEPADVDDWEVVEANAEYLTDQMLNQACCDRCMLDLPRTTPAYSITVHAMQRVNLQMTRRATCQEQIEQSPSGLQVGVVAVGQPFPFWVRKNTTLTLKVSAAVPADLVRPLHAFES